MSEIPFHKTGYGRKFFDMQLPALIRALNRVAGAMERESKKVDAKPERSPDPVLPVVNVLARDAIDLLQGVGGCVLPAKEQDEAKELVLSHLTDIVRHTTSEGQPPPMVYDPEHDQEEECECGHTYERHFDWNDDYRPGCKYCPCYHFVPKKPEVWEPLDDLGDVMKLSAWIGGVVHGDFIDYDGHGHYVRDGKMLTSVVVKPSMLKEDRIDHSYDQIVWFNR